MASCNRKKTSHDHNNQDYGSDDIHDTGTTTDGSTPRPRHVCNVNRQTTEETNLALLVLDSPSLKKMKYLVTHAPETDHHLDSQIGEQCNHAY
jgi:hypothetical protein